MKKIILFLSFFILGLVSAQETTDIKETIEKANAGDESAQLMLGIFNSITNTEQGYKEAIYWFTRAAEQGNSVAQFQLGFFYHKGMGGEQSDNKTFYWWRKAAEQGNSDAQYRLNGQKCCSKVLQSLILSTFAAI